MMLRYSSLIYQYTLSSKTSDISHTHALYYTQILVVSHQWTDTQKNNSYLTHTQIISHAQITSHTHIISHTQITSHTQIISHTQISQVTSTKKSFQTDIPPPRSTLTLPPPSLLQCMLFPNLRSGESLESMPRVQWGARGWFRLWGGCWVPWIGRYWLWMSHVSVLQCVVVCCSVLQCVAVYCSVLQCIAVCCSVLQCVAVCCSVLQCVAVCCSALLCVAVCCCAGCHDPKDIDCGCVV